MKGNPIPNVCWNDRMRFCNNKAQISSDEPEAQKSKVSEKLTESIKEINGIFELTKYGNK